MSRIIVVTSGKGGVGKTTITANLGYSLARNGRKVALVDADFGLRNLDLLMGLESRVVYTAIEAMAGECRLEQALVKDKRQHHLVLLPAAQHRNKEAIDPTQMKEVVGQIAKTYEYILIDSPAGIEIGFRNAITPAKEALIVSTPEVASVRDADRVIGLLEANGIEKIRLIVNRIKPDMVQMNEMMGVDDVLDVLSIPLVGIVPDDKRMIVASNRGEPVVCGLPDSIPAIAFDNIARRLEGEKVPLLDLMAAQDNLINRIRRLFQG